MINNKIRLKKSYIVEKLLKHLSESIYVNKIRQWFNIKELLIEENMIIRYISLPKGKGYTIDALLKSYIQSNFIKEEKLLFNYKVVSFKEKEKGILLYCIRNNVELEKLLKRHNRINIIPYQEYIYKKVIRKFPKEEKILAFYFSDDGRGIFNVIYKKHLIYTGSLNNDDLDRLDEIIDDCSNQIINICSLKKEDWTLILINKGIDKVKSSCKNIEEMNLVRSC